MSASSNKNSTREPKQIEQAVEGHELILSADKKWMRLHVDGKLVVSFHVNYVNKVLGNVADKANEVPQKRSAPSAMI